MIIVSFHAWLLFSSMHDCFPSMHDYCFLPCMIIVSFHAWLLFPSIHAVSGDRFVSFKADGDRRDGSFFFYRAGYRTGWADGRTKTNVAPKDIHALFFLVVGDEANTVCLFSVSTVEALCFCMGLIWLKQICSPYPLRSYVYPYQFVYVFPYPIIQGDLTNFLSAVEVHLAFVLYM